MQFLSNIFEKLTSEMLIYFKKNLVLWAGRYEDEFFNDTPETQVDIEAGGEEEEIDLGGEEEMESGSEEAFEL